MNKEGKKGLFIERLQSNDFCCYYEQKKFIEDFLNKIDEEMKLKGISRSELAKRMKCKAANIAKIMRCTKNLTVEEMISIAFHLGFRLQLKVVPKGIE